MASKYEDWGGRKWRKDNILELKVPEKKQKMPIIRRIWLGSSSPLPDRSQLREPNCIKFIGQSSMLSRIVFLFQIWCSISKRKRLKDDLCRKSMQNFTLFTPYSLTFRGGVGEMSESIFRARRKTQLLTYFWWGPLAVWETKRQLQNINRIVRLLSGGGLIRTQLYCRHDKLAKHIHPERETS